MNTQWLQQKFQTTHGLLPLQSLFDQYNILYFYPKDNTPGCTREAIDFATSYPTFRKLNCQVIGVSRDGINSHQRFEQKYQLPFPLVSDEDGLLSHVFAVFQQKTLFGKLIFGVRRSTFLLDQLGVTHYAWPSVKVAGHIQHVLTVLREQVSIK